MLPILAHRHPEPRFGAYGRQGSILLFLIGLTTIMLVIAFAFLRSMQMARGTTLVQRKDDLARLAAEMGMQHAMAVCMHEYGMANEVRDNLNVPALSNSDSPNSNVFQLLSRRKSSAAISTHTPEAYDMAPDVAFQSQFHHGTGGGTGRTIGYSSGTITKPGWARWTEANRFWYRPNAIGATYDPSTYDLYSTTTPDPAVVKTAFPPVDPFVRGTALTKRHASDNPLLLDADCRPVTTVADARYRLRYAVAIDDMSAALWLNTDLPWLTAFQKAQCRSAYKESIYALGMQLAGLEYDRSDSFENIFLGHGAYANSLFVNGQAREWAERGGAAMWYRSPSKASERALHCVLGSPFMNWNDPGGNWIGSSLTSYNDLGFAMQNHASNWHMAGEVMENQSRVRGDLVAQRCVTPFGRPRGAGTDHPWALNALMIAPRVLEAMVTAYMPPAVRAVAVSNEICTPYVTSGTAPNTINSFNSFAANKLTWAIPASANITIPGLGPDLFTDAFQPGGMTIFPSYPTPAMRDYWTTPVGSVAAPTTWRSNHNAVNDTRTHAQRYPGSAFFSDMNLESLAQTPMIWRFKAVDGITPYDGLIRHPRQLERDAPTGAVPPSWALATAYAVGVWSREGGNNYRCIKAHTSMVNDRPGAGSNWRTFWALESGQGYTPGLGSDHLGRHIIFYKEDSASSLAAAGSNLKFLSFFGSGSVQKNWADEFVPTHPFGTFQGGAGADGRMCPYRNYTAVIYTPAIPVLVGAEIYPAGSWTPTDKVNALGMAPSARGGGSGLIPTVITPEGWKIERTTAGGWGTAASGAYLNSYYLRLFLAFGQAVHVAQAANLSWANRQDVRSQTLWNMDGINLPGSGINYTATPDRRTNTSYLRKGRVANKHPSDPKVGDLWQPAAADFATIEHLDRQFLANLGESYMQPGRRLPSEAQVERPPRYIIAQGTGRDRTITTYQTATSLSVAEYRVTNNIRTLLTPIDTTVGGATLTASSLDPQTGSNEPPHKLWLLDEWNAGSDPGYVPGTTVSPQPTMLAHARAKLMERVLNDWRLSFLGSGSAYKDAFRPKDFDGDGRVFCSGYLVPSAPDGDCGLTCWKSAFGNGDGPGIGVQATDPATADPTQRLTLFSLTGCLTMERSQQYKIRVRGELYDNFIDRAVSEQYLESALLVDPDSNVSRGAPSSNIEDTILIFQHPVHSYYRGYLNRAYP